MCGKIKNNTFNLNLLLVGGQLRIKDGQVKISSLPRTAIYIGEIHISFQVICLITLNTNRCYLNSKSAVTDLAVWNSGNQQ